MATDQTFVIVGAMLAGAKAAETRPSEGCGGRMWLGGGAKGAGSVRGGGLGGGMVGVGEEPVRPYERPPLSKTYLRGEVGFDSAAVHPPDFYKDHDIELLTSTVVTS